MQVEDYCCFLGAYKLVLPSFWRDEDIRVRESIAGDYSQYSRKDRNGRILDDVWPQYLAMVPKLCDILYKIPKLKDKEGEERAEAARQLELDLRCWETEADHFFNLPHVLEVLGPAESPPSYPSRHAACCPPPAFVPYYMQYPPAGLFRINVTSVKCYIRALMLPSIWEAQGSKFERIDEEAMGFSLESCRAFAGLEETLGDGDVDDLLPLFAPLVLATTTCPPECRIWLWYKLRHFEKVGHIQFDRPLKKSLATLWNMPQIMSGSSPPPVDVDYLKDIEPGIRGMELRGDHDEEGDHEDITRAKGLGQW